MGAIYKNGVKYVGGNNISDNYESPTSTWSSAKIAKAIEESSRTIDGHWEIDDNFVVTFKEN